MQRSPLIFNNYRVENEANGTLDIYIDGYIVDAPTQEIMREYWGDETSVSYKSVRDQVISRKPTDVNVWVNSGGGQICDAMAIHDLIVDMENKGTKVNCYGRGLIASAATYILMASRNSEISENSWFMIHNASGAVAGDVNEIENYAKMMRKFNDQIRDFYASYTNQPKETIAAWMNKETWLTGKEAKDKGFVKSVSGRADITNTIAIKPESWPFQNTAILNAYNSNVKNNQPDMKFDIKKIGEEILNTVKAALNIGKPEEVKPSEMKAEDLQNTISTAVTNAVQAVEATISEAIDNGISEGITNALKDDGAIAKLINGLIEGALKNATADKGLIAELVTTSVNALTGEKGAVTEAIANATKDLVPTKVVDDLKTDLANKIITAGNKTKKEGAAEDKGQFNHEGVNWGSN